MAIWDDILGTVGDVWDWFEGSDTAQDILGSVLQKSLWDQPELDYDKIMEMAVKQALIDSPDQYTPTMASTWEVDPTTGKRVQNVQYRPEFQGLLDMLVNEAGTLQDTYRAPTGMTEGLLGSRMNHLLGQSGMAPVDHQRYQFPTREPAGGTDSFGVEDDESEPSSPAGPGSVRVGPGINPGPRDSNAPGGGYRGPGDTGFDPNDPSADQQGLIRDLIDRGYMNPGQSIGDVDWGEVFSDDNLEWLEKWGDNKLVRAALGALVPLGGVGSKVAAWFAGRELDQRAGADLSDFENRNWGSYDPWSTPTDGYWETLLGRAPGVNPQTGARLGEAGGMPGAQQNQDQITDMYGGVERHPFGGRGDAWNAVGNTRTFGDQAFGVGDWGGPGELMLDPRLRKFWGGPETRKKA